MKTVSVKELEEDLEFIKEAQKFFFAPQKVNEPDHEYKRRTQIQNVYYASDKRQLAIRDRADYKSFMIVSLEDTVANNAKIVEVY